MEKCRGGETAWKFLPISDDNTKDASKEANSRFTRLETQYLHLATFNLLPPPSPPPPAPSPTRMFFLRLPALPRTHFAVRSDSSLPEGSRKEPACVSALKFLSQNYNSLRGKLTGMKKQCNVNGVSSPSPHGSPG